jgi:hypothetical protein
MAKVGTNHGFQNARCSLDGDRRSGLAAGGVAPAKTARKIIVPHSKYGLPSRKKQVQHTVKAAQLQLKLLREAAMRPVYRITLCRKHRKAFDYLPESADGDGFLVTDGFEAAFKRVFNDDDFTPSAIRAAAKRKDPRLDEVRRICTASHASAIS